MLDENPQVWWSNNEIRQWAWVHCCPLPVNRVMLGGAVSFGIPDIAEIYWELEGFPVRRISEIL